MANTRSLSSVTAPAPSPATGTAPPVAPRHRLRAVDRDEVVDIRDFLPPGATWLPAPQHTLPTLPGQPPMVGYLVLVPADQHPAALAVAVPEPETGRPPAPESARNNNDGSLIDIDPAQRTASVDGKELELTYLEFELLTHLVTHPNQVHTRDRLVTTVWGYGHVGDGRTVDVHIARLRRKLGARFRDAIQTVRRVGYKYTPPTAH